MKLKKIHEIATLSAKHDNKIFLSLCYSFFYDYGLMSFEEYKVKFKELL